MLQNTLTDKACYLNDAAFDLLYPERIQRLSREHWTPMRIAKRAGEFLASAPGKKILDIGSGVGKFCLIGGHFFPEVSFYGVEQREDLHKVAASAQRLTGANNVNFIHGNFTRVDFAAYDHFYFYNAFFEHLSSDGHIDQQTEYSTILYYYYSQRLFKELDTKPSGTRLVTFHSLEDEVPPRYQLVDATADFLLKMWIKR
jgi:hypothetical protein